MDAKPNEQPSTWIDPDDGPEWTDEQFARAEFRIGDRVIRPATGTLMKAGRPRLANPKWQVTVRLDGEVIDRLRASGAGWQSRINALLRRELGLSDA